MTTFENPPFNQLAESTPRHKKIGLAAGTICFGLCVYELVTFVGQGTEKAQTVQNIPYETGSGVGEHTPVKTLTKPVETAPQATATALPTVRPVIKHITVTSPNNVPRPKLNTQAKPPVKKPFVKVGPRLLYPVDGNAPGGSIYTSEISQCYVPGGHPGVDMDQVAGANVYAAASGTIVFDGYARGYGDHYLVMDNGFVLTGYGHMMASDARVGEHYNQGNVIGKVGDEGESTAYHLHLNTMAEGTPSNGWYNTNIDPGLVGLVIPPNVYNPRNCT
jgi:murein DD-endopeptidase MepM/ murein hydrolase activator NlpD